MLPKDPYILLSVVNTKLRDRYQSLEDLCEDLQADAGAVREALAAIGYYYDPEGNRFA